jgi:hypothetical protein
VSACDNDSGGNLHFITYSALYGKAYRVPGNVFHTLCHLLTRTPGVMAAVHFEGLPTDFSSAVCLSVCPLCLMSCMAHRSRQKPHVA